MRVVISIVAVCWFEELRIAATGFSRVSQNIALTSWLLKGPYTEASKKEKEKKSYFWLLSGPCTYPSRVKER